ncbi:glycoside hydrolase 43 family protein [Salinimicrobium sp. MT39]|uniref:Glycoside hydrolase 43 family protein n=1 Tax=Salinimicrobium profundisediminis TaxID=2994553 RepID=A0A9X3CWY3_9FLAO|nr:glycoside hydrolase 43 family protein [Salinimicrobium profundisediminis]MCX2838229.1 glycoside hydrolase 43 family protein [Salinimicrobium profundisediminis]
MKRLKNLAAVLVLLVFGGITMNAQNSENFKSDVWVADQGDGTYKNPILHADYSDPDVVRVGSDFYMTSSSFNSAPALPILHSKDLVNWKLIGHALDRQVPDEHFSKPQHGNGVWAPAFRYHEGEYYIYWGDPDFGIYMVKTKDPAGEWEEPVLVEAGKGLIDPAPLWDEDGKAYLSHAFAGSRAGIKSILVVKPLNWEGTKTTGAGKIVFDGHEDHPTVEGTKFYKKDGYYYIFAPAGGVSTGWQLILRSKNPYGPYEEHVSLAQGNTDINGPHQGAWVELENGEDWFIHFQDKEAYGRIVHLQPMTWKNGWPTMGEDKDGDGTGEPVMSFRKPNVGKIYPIQTPKDSDEFSGNDIGLQWQWQANPNATWAFANPAKDQLRFYTQLLPEAAKNLWDSPGLLLQKFPAEEFTSTTKLTFNPNKNLENEKAGLIVMGRSYAYVALESRKDGIYVVYAEAEKADEGNLEQKEQLKKLSANTAFLRVEVDKKAQCTFSYSEDGKKYIEIDEDFSAREGKWVGAKIGIFATKEQKTNDSGYADFDWFRFSK